MDPRLLRLAAQVRDDRLRKLAPDRAIALRRAVRRVPGCFQTDRDRVGISAGVCPDVADLPPERVILRPDETRHRFNGERAVDRLCGERQESGLVLAREFAERFRTTGVKEWPHIGGPGVMQFKEEREA